MRQTPREINRLETDMLIFLRRTKTVADALMKDYSSSLPPTEDRDLLVGIVEEAQILLLKSRNASGLSKLISSQQTPSGYGSQAYLV